MVEVNVTSKDVIFLLKKYLCSEIKLKEMFHHSRCVGQNEAVLVLSLMSVYTGMQ